MRIILRRWVCFFAVSSLSSTATFTYAAPACAPAPTVAGKTFVRNLAGVCEKPLKQSQTRSCNEQIVFDASGHASMTFHGSDLADRVPYTQEGICISVKLAAGQVYAEEKSRKSTWLLSLDGKTLTNVEEKTLFTLAP